MVVLRVSPRAVRVQFDKEFLPNCLQKTLKSELGCLSKLKMEKRITQPQWNWLFPRPVLAIPTVEIQQSFYNVNSGSLVTLDCSVSTSLPITSVQWQRNIGGSITAINNILVNNFISW